MNRASQITETKDSPAADDQLSGLLDRLDTMSQQIATIEALARSTQRRLDAMAPQVKALDPGAVQRRIDLLATSVSKVVTGANARNTAMDDVGRLVERLGTRLDAIDKGLRTSITQLGQSIAQKDATLAAATRSIDGAAIRMREALDSMQAEPDDGAQDAKLLARLATLEGQLQQLLALKPPDFAVELAHIEVRLDALMDVERREAAKQPKPRKISFNVIYDGAGDVRKLVATEGIE